jgi:SPP1 family predicted phage head-tail adaptor
MNPGKLRLRFQVQEQLEVKDEMGGVRDDWHTLMTVWGDVTQEKGQEDFQAKQVSAEVKYRLSLRYIPEFNPNWRLRLVGTSRYFHPTSTPDKQERHREMVILAIETLEGAIGGKV